MVRNRGCLVDIDGRSVGVGCRRFNRRPFADTSEFREPVFGVPDPRIRPRRHHLTVGAALLDRDSVTVDVPVHHDRSPVRGFRRIHHQHIAVILRSHMPQTSSVTVTIDRMETAAGGQHQCRFCGQRFDTHKGCKVHETSHRQEPCRWCGHTFSVRGLPRHERCCARSTDATAVTSAAALNPNVITGRLHEFLAHTVTVPAAGFVLIAPDRPVCFVPARNLAALCVQSPTAVVIPVAALPDIDGTEPFEATAPKPDPEQEAVDEINALHHPDPEDWWTEPELPLSFAS